MEQIVFGKFEKPVAESKYIVSVKAREPGWQSLLYFATQEGMTIFPAHVLKTLTGAGYQRDWNYKALPGTGPYALAEADIAKGRSISLRRRNDYWAAKERRNIGRANFDELRFLVVRDENLAFEMFKKGDYDFHYETISRRWIEEMKFDAVERGLIQKRKIYNDNPSGTQGLALNTRKAPFDDIRLRKAMAHLLDRPKLIKTLFLNEYPPLNSYYAGGIYENPDNPKMPYDPQLALQLLGEAGWKSRDAQGRLVKDGRPLMLELQYSDKNSERWLTVYQDDLRKVGITLNLRLITPETRFQLQQQRKFDMTYTAWAANTFPSLETEYSSTLADVPGNNNITGIKDKRIDEIIDLYNAEYDQKKREVLIRELDGILANLHHYVLLWDAPFQRIAFWNRFGYPEFYLSRVDDYSSAAWLWWVDPAREAQLAASRRDPAAKLPIPPLEARYWQDYAKREHAVSEHSVGSIVK
jgi:microcin C transport system substrate-binding protein